MIDETELPDYIAAYQEALARWQLNQRTLRIGFDHQNLPAPAIMTESERRRAFKKAGTMAPSILELRPQQ